MVPAPAAALRPSVAMAAPNKLGAPMPPADVLARPAPVEAPSKPRALVRTIWRKGESPLASAKPVPKPVEVHRSASANTQERVAAGSPSGADQPQLDAVTAPLKPAIVDAPVAARVAGFAAAAQAAGAAGSGPRSCRISAGDGGDGRIVLVRVASAGEDLLTPVSTGPASRDSTVAGLVAERMPGAEIVGVFEGYEPALIEARRLCPRG